MNHWPVAIFAAAVLLLTAGAAFIVGLVNRAITRAVRLPNA